MTDFAANPRRTRPQLGGAPATTDRDQTTHAFAMDILGRMTSDTITAFGSADSPASQHAFAFNALGLLYLATTSNSQGPLNQVERLHNGLGQLTGEYQEAFGAVNTSTSPEVQYVYDTPAHGSRLEEIVYPSGYTLHQGYDGNALDNAISRVDYLADDNGSGGVGQHLEEYSYLGLNTIVIRNRPQEQAQLTYVKQSGESTGDAGDQYTGLDRFGRVDDQRWIPISNPTSPIARFQQGYDRDSNVLWKLDLVTSNSSELFAYDNLNRLTSFNAGTLSVDHTSITGTPTYTWGVTLDNIGNRDTATVNGTPISSTFNARNQQTAYGAATLTNDSNGALTTDQTGQTFTYDGWGELHANTDSSVFYFYDALGRRISNDHTEQLIYSQDGQVLEDRHMHKDQNLNVVLDSIDRQIRGKGYIDQMALRDHLDESTQTTTRVYALQDANYNTVAITDSTGALLDRFAYDPDGNVRSGNPSADGWIYLWQGLRRESAGTTFLIDGRSRFYSPALGRWIQPDIAYLDGTNLYQGFGSNPVNRIDPFGRASVGIVNPGANGGAGGHAFVIVNTPDGPMVYTFQPPNGWYGPIPAAQYVGHRPLGDQINIYPLPGVNDNALNAALAGRVHPGPNHGPHYGEGGEVCSTQTAAALQDAGGPKDLIDLMDRFLSEDGIKGPTLLQYYLKEYEQKHGGLPYTIAPSPGYGRGSSSSWSSAVSSSLSLSGLFSWLFSS